MARPTQTPASKWVEEGLRALAVGGPDAVRIEVLAREMGVTKGGFYNHFPDRPAFFEEMLHTWERVIVDRVIDHVDAGPADAKARLHRLVDVAISAKDLINVEIAIRDWSRRDPNVATLLRRVDRRRLEYMRDLFSAFIDDPKEVDRRCLLVFALYIAMPSITDEVVAPHWTATYKDVITQLIET